MPKRIEGDAMTNIYYPYKTFIEDVKALVELTKDFKPDGLLGIARGGLTLTHAYAQATENRNLFIINSILYDGEVKRSHPKLLNLPELGCCKQVLILDDIVDSGETLKAVLRVLQERYPDIDFKSVVLFSKPNALIEPDYFLHETNEWIDFFWEKDFMDK
ncbi:MAG: phosphoribosyltransferase domain-containing protein [Sulfurovum sp.]|nr:phosphoribosyltransferase domain-containing protein [Sulfurovum sp.]